VLGQLAGRGAEGRCGRLDRLAEKSSDAWWWLRCVDKSGFGERQGAIWVEGRNCEEQSRVDGDSDSDTREQQVFRATEVAQ